MSIDYIAYALCMSLYYYAHRLHKLCLAYVPVMPIDCITFGLCMSPLTLYAHRLHNLCGRTCRFMPCQDKSLVLQYPPYYPQVIHRPSGLCYQIPLPVLIISLFKLNPCNSLHIPQQYSLWLGGTLFPCINFVSIRVTLSHYFLFYAHYCIPASSHLRHFVWATRW